MFVDGKVYLGLAQLAKDEELRGLLRKKGYKVLELRYNNYSGRQRDQLYAEILDNLGMIWLATR